MKLEGMNIKKRLNFGYTVVIAMMVVSGLVGILALTILKSGLNDFVNGSNKADTAVKICRIFAKWHSMMTRAAMPDIVRKWAKSLMK